VQGVSRRSFPQIRGFVDEHGVAAHNVLARKALDVLEHLRFLAELPHLLVVLKVLDFGDRLLRILTGFRSGFGELERRC
jgi:hypothetical protein